MQDISVLLEKLKQEPFTELSVFAPHSGVVNFEPLCSGDRVNGASGEWREIPGSKLATLVRENNPQPVRATDKGVIQSLETGLEGCFVQAGTLLGVIRHYLSKQEVVRKLLQQSLSLFYAPERAKYFFVPDIDKKVKIQGFKSVTIHPGDELFIASRMKREVPVNYTGQEGIIYEIYFQQNQNVDAGAPLIGVCPHSERDQIDEAVTRVQMEWNEVE